MELLETEPLTNKILDTWEPPVWLRPAFDGTELDVLLRAPTWRVAGELEHERGFAWSGYHSPAGVIAEMGKA